MDELIMVGQMDNTMDNTHESANRVYSVEGIAPTIPTMAGGNIQPKFLEVKQICAMRGRNPDNPSDRTTGSPTEQRLEPNAENICNTLTSVQKDNLVIEKKIQGMKTAILPVIDTVHIKQATKEGTIECKVGGVADLTYPDSKTRRGRVQDGGDTSPAITAEGELCKIERYRIRKLTPRECWRLMGYTDADFDKAQAVNSNTQLYKQAGNAIVKQVLMAIFRQMNIRSAK